MRTRLKSPLAGMEVGRFNLEVEGSPMRGNGLGSLGIMANDRPTYIIKAKIAGSSFNPQDAIFKLDDMIRRSGWNPSIRLLQTDQGVVGKITSFFSAGFVRWMTVEIQMLPPKGSIGSAGQAFNIAQSAAVRQSFSFSTISQAVKEGAAFAAQAPGEAADFARDTVISGDECQLFGVKCKYYVYIVGGLVVVSLLANIRSFIPTLGGVKPKRKRKRRRQRRR